MHLFAGSSIPDMMHIYIYMYVWTQNFRKKGFQAADVYGKNHLFHWLEKAMSILASSTEQ